MLFKKNNSAKITSSNFSLEIKNLQNSRTQLVQNKLETYFTEIISEFSRWALTSKEVTNFTYDISELNIKYLSSIISDATDVNIVKINSYIDEINANENLQNQYSIKLNASIHASRLDERLKLGRRIGWYAIIRALKPQVVVESGIDAGIGALAILEALKLNDQENFKGEYIGIDIAENAGSLIKDDYQKFSKIIYRDSIETIKSIKSKIDLFISDSNHDPLYESQEYEAILPKLSKNGMILADNAHCSDALYEFSIKYNRIFKYFHEMPVNHWMAISPAGIGISYSKD